VLQGTLVLALALAGTGFWALVLGHLISQVWAVFWLVRESRWRPRLRWPSATSGALLAFGLHSAGASVLSYVYNNSDFFAVGRMWLPSVMALRLLSLVGLFMILGASLNPVFNALGRPDIPMKQNLALVLLLPVSFFVAAGRYGIVGVCVVWLVAFPCTIVVL